MKTIRYIQLEKNIAQDTSKLKGYSDADKEKEALEAPQCATSYMGKSLSKGEFPCRIMEYAGNTTPKEIRGAFRPTTHISLLLPAPTLPGKGENAPQQH